MVNYSKKIRMVRESLGLSQAALGSSIGLTNAHISRLESGKNDVSQTILQKYVDVFGVDPEWLNSEETDSKVKFIGNKIDGAETIGDRIKNLRLEMDMSQKKFAEYAGIHPSDINKVESGKASLGPQTLTRIAEAFHVGIEWLQYGDESKKTYPVDEKVIEYLWGHEKLREMIYQYMNENTGKE